MGAHHMRARIRRDTDARNCVPREYSTPNRLGAARRIAENGRRAFACGARIGGQSRLAEVLRANERGGLIVQHEFSERGEMVTELERELVASAPLEFPESMSDLWVLLARRIGVDALVVMFDEVGGEKVHVPTRAEFFSALYRPRRDTRIRELCAGGMSGADVAVQFGLTRMQVHRIVRARDDARREIVVIARR